MPTKITFHVIQGQLDQGDYVFEDRTTCIVGRAKECHPRIPNDEENLTISRSHCLLDINPPDIRIRDFGSRNGTFVNDLKIGQREKGMTAEEAAGSEFPEHDLKDGDEIRIGKTVFRVGIYVPAVCAECSKEIPEGQRQAAEVRPGVYQCDTCRKKALAAKRKAPVAPKPKRCAKCGRDVSREVGANRQGLYVCASCRAKPADLIKILLQRARAGQKDLLAIKGYSILRELGRGGMGAVYLARHDGTGEQVALKVMLPQVAANERSKAMFLREVACTKALKHPNIVELKDSGCSDGTFFFTLEFCDGGSVDKLVAKRGGTLPVEEACKIILDTLTGLEHAHTADITDIKLPDGGTTQAKGLVHRDLSPQNIFLSGPDKTAKVADYGLSKAFDIAGLSGQTRTGVAAGKPVFMPRQQVINFKYSKPDVDVWAAAACLYNMLTGRFPRDFVRGKDPWQTVLTSRPVPILERKPSLPERLAEVIDHTLIDEPAIQVKTASELKAALEGVL